MDFFEAFTVIMALVMCGVLWASYALSRMEWFQHSNDVVKVAIAVIAFSVIPATAVALGVWWPY